MLMRTELRDDQHVYLQVANILRNQISYNQITDRLPSIQELSKLYSINAKTANKAVLLLEKEGLVYRRKGKGTFVIRTDLLQNGLPTIGLVFSDIVNPNFALLAEAIQRKAHAKQMSMLISTTAGKAQRLANILKMYKLKNVQAVIIQGGAIRTKACQELIYSAGLPLVGDHTHSTTIDDVWLDVRAGAQLAVTHLIRRFGPEVGYVSGSSEPPTSTGRYQGFRDALLAADASPEPNFIKRSEPTYIGGFKATLQVFEAKRQPRSVFYYNLAMAMGGLSALLSLRLTVPQNVAIAACDDSIAPENMITPTTTVQFSYEEEARQIINLVDRRLNYPTLPPLSIRIAPRLIVRKSSGGRI